MDENTKKKLAFITTVASVVAIGGLYSYNSIPYQSTMKPSDLAKPNISSKDGHSENYLPMFKDDNNICGIAKDKNGNMFAIASNDICPTNESLSKNYGYEYVSLTENFSPSIQNGNCGTAKFLKESNRMGKKDMAKLMAMANGDIDNIPVSANQDGKCPSSQELSDIVTNSIGVPVHFAYNNLNANPNNYPVVTVNSNDTNEIVELVSEQDHSIVGELGKGKKRLTDVTGKNIPLYLINNASNSVCENNYSDKCMLVFDQKGKYTYLLNRDTKEKYEVKSQNNVIIPDNALTKGAWDVCQGDFGQCDFMPDDNNPLTGEFINNVTGSKYHTPTFNSEVVFE